MRAGQREGRVVVVEHCARPGRGGVAGGAAGREASRLVIRIGGAVVVLGMAGVAVGRGPSEDVIDVAARAGHGGVRAGQREGRVVVVEDRAGPACGGMAGCARRREASGLVIRIGRAGEVLGVARVAIRRSSSKHVIDVAAGAGDRRVRAGQRERRLVVIEDRARPRGGGVAGLAGGGEAGGHVIRIRSAVEVLGVAGVAICRRSRKHIIDVAAGAGDGSVCAGERERASCCDRRPRPPTRSWCGKSRRWSEKPAVLWFGFVVPV